MCALSSSTLTLLRSWREGRYTWTQQRQALSIKNHRATLDYLTLELNGDWNEPQRRKMMFALLFKLPYVVHHWPTASSAARESRRWDVITTIKRIIWCKWTPRCSRVPCVTITLHCNLLMWLHYNIACKGVPHRAQWYYSSTPGTSHPSSHCSWG